MIKIGGIVENRDLTLYQITSLLDQPGVAGRILNFFATRKINFEYITESSTARGTAVIAVGIRLDAEQEFDRHLAKYQETEDTLQVKKTENISILGIYGPHFREKPALAAEFCITLGDARINILGLSSSISSICAAISSDEMDKAKDALLKRFSLP